MHDWYVLPVRINQSIHNTTTIPVWQIISRIICASREIHVSSKVLSQSETVDDRLQFAIDMNKGAQILDTRYTVIHILDLSTQDNDLVIISSLSSNFYTKIVLNL